MSEARDRLDAAAPGPAAFDLREAERYCQQMARREARNFYWGFVSLPAEQRTSIYALYDFARQVDDVADSAGAAGGPAGRAGLEAALGRQRARAREAAAGRWSDPVTMVLAGAMRRHAIPESELQALIDGVEMDLTRTRYATWQELEAYCRLVASTIGRMCVRIFGFDDPAALERADELGIALQLTNILRDVREDGHMGRVYLPREDLERFGVPEEGLLRAEPGPGWEPLIEFEVGRAGRYFAGGLGVCQLIPGRSAACVRTMAGIYRRILGMVERHPRLPLERRASLSPAAKLAVMARSWARV